MFQNYHLKKKSCQNVEEIWGLECEEATSNSMSLNFILHHCLIIIRRTDMCLL